MKTNIKEEFDKVTNGRKVVEAWIRFDPKNEFSTRDGIDTFEKLLNQNYDNKNGKDFFAGEIIFADGMRLVRVVGNDGVQKWGSPWVV